MERGREIIVLRLCVHVCVRACAGKDDTRVNTGRTTQRIRHNGDLGEQDDHKRPIFTEWPYSHDPTHRKTPYTQENTQCVCRVMAVRLIDTDPTICRFMAVRLIEPEHTTLTSVKASRKAQPGPSPRRFGGLRTRNEIFQTNKLFNHTTAQTAPWQPK